MPSSQVTAVAALVIRDLSSPAELRDAEDLQKEVWGIGDRDVVPLSQFVAARAAGGVLVGAFDGGTLAGFAYGFPSIDEEGPAMHSHLLAVKPAYRRRRVGYDLKQAQRERTLAKGLTRMTWTFDPLRSVNAHLNFARLGVVCDRYLRDFYGQESDSALDRDGTDRLWVTWLLDSERVTARLNSKLPAATGRLLASARPLVEAGPDGGPITPATGDSCAGRLIGSDPLFIQIPDATFADRHPELFGRWRRATRTAFTQALEAGYKIEEYCASRTESGSARQDAGQSGAYILAPPADA